VSKAKCILLFSGGLDSLLAARVLQEQDIEVIGFHCLLPFISPDVNPEEMKLTRLAAQIGLTLRFFRCGKEYIDMIRNPEHGYGKHANPCIDCHIYFILKAVALMKDMEADFVATGEVVGQRPMSQMKHTLNHIEKATGVQGLLLRPLSAKLLKPTIPEKNHMVNRDMLLAINGRSRKAQLELAQKYHIVEYASPSGGCLFTDKYISKRVFDLIQFHSECELIDFYLLTIGRHFRISDNAKLIVARNENENNILQNYMHDADFFFIPTYPAPAVFVRGMLSDSEISSVGSIIRRYSKAQSENQGISVFVKGAYLKTIMPGMRMIDDDLEAMRIR
jgi:tRNA-specific 2-thiouridylase